MKRINYYVSLVLVLFIVACSRNKLPENNLDTQLIELLKSRAIDQRLSSLILPESYNLNELPQDVNNQITPEKIALGKLLFHETALALKPLNTISYNAYSCATCHHVDAGFQSGIRQGIADGGEGFGLKGEARHKVANCPDELCDVQPIKSPSILNSAYQSIMLWNGQFGAGNMNKGTEALWKEDTPLEANKLGYEGVETQAIAGFSVHRMDVDTNLLFNEPYLSLFLDAFPEVSDFSALSVEEVVEKIGLAVGAYERSVIANMSPYQRWLKGVQDALTDHQKEGMRLFFDKAECYSCHNGPALNSMSFHALGMGDLEGEGVVQVDGTSANKGRGGFTKVAEDNYKFKVPQLYNLSDAGFFGHGSTFNSIEEVIEYKNNAVSQNSNVPNSQLAAGFKPLNLTSEEIAMLVDFIENGLYDSELERYVPSSVPSGNCIPNNDSLSKLDLCQ